MKCYNITVTGKVQDTGFRAIAEYAGRLLDLSGLVFNDRTGGVRIMCRGDEGGIADFSQEIIKRGTQRGAIIQDIIRQELPVDIALPYPFSRVLTDDDPDLGRKLDKGNELLTDIKKDTSEIKVGIDTLNTNISSFILEQREHNSRMDEHNLRLEKILEKLAEK